jgi:hypothetical protein
VFLPEQTNSIVSGEMHDVVSNLKQGKPVFIIGYGSSGAGKTSSLIYFNNGEGDQKDGVLIWLCKQLCSGNDAPYNKVKFYIEEFYATTDAEITAPKFIRTPSATSTSTYYEYDYQGGEFNPTEPTKALINSKQPSHKYRTEPRFVEQEITIEVPSIETTGTKPGSASVKPTDIGSVLIDLIDTDRFVKATTNNPNSSRSHVLVYVQLSRGDKSAILVIGDLAGVENEFKCGEFETVQNFLNIQRDLDEGRRFYSTEYYQGNGNINISDYAGTQKGKGEFDKITGGGYDAKDGFDDTYLNKVIVQVDSKNPENSNTNISASTVKQLLDLDLQKISTTDKFQTDWDAKILKLLPYAPDDVSDIDNQIAKKNSEIAITKSEITAKQEMQKNSEQYTNINQIKQDLYNKFTKNFSYKIDYHNDKTNTTKTNILGLEDFFSGKPDLDEYTNQKITINPSITDQKVVLNRYPITLVPIKGNDNKDKKDRALFFNTKLNPIEKNNIIVKDNTKNTQIKTTKNNENYEVVIIIANDYTQKIGKKDDVYAKIRYIPNAANNNIEFVININLGAYVISVYEIIISITKEMEDALKEENMNKQISELANIDNTIKQLTNTLNRLNGELTALNAQKTYKEKENAKNEENIKTSIRDTLKINTEGITNIKDLITQIKNLYNISPNIKRVIDIIKKRYNRGKNACEKRLVEGKFINKSLNDIRSTISDMMHVKTGGKEFTPNYNNLCINKYCPTGVDCFKPEEQLTPTTDSIKSKLFEHIYKGIKELTNKTDTYTNQAFYTELLVCMFCVFNVARRANNPPASTYIDINELKYFVNSRGQAYNTYTTTEQTKIKDKLLGILDSIIKQDLKNKFLNDSIINKITEIHTRVNELTAQGAPIKYDAVMIKAQQESVQDIISSIDNHNAASTMGTLEFIDKFAKLYSTKNICTIEKPSDIKNGKIVIGNTLFTEIQSI